MNRRTYLASAGATLVAVAGGTAVASAARADIPAERELTRAAGEPDAIERTITRESVQYLESTDEVSEHGDAEPFDEWARRECEEVAADEVVAVVEDRLGRSVEGVGSGVRYLLFGPVVTVDHTVTRGRDGAVVSEPDVPLDRLIEVAPRTLSVGVTLDGRAFSRELPVGVGHVEESMD